VGQAVGHPLNLSMSFRSYVSGSVGLHLTWECHQADQVGQLACAQGAEDESGSRDLGEDEEEDDSEDDGSSVSLVSEDDIPSANVRSHVSEELEQAAKRRRP